MKRNCRRIGSATSARKAKWPAMTRHNAHTHFGCSLAHSETTDHITQRRAHLPDGKAVFFTCALLPKRLKANNREKKKQKLYLPFFALRACVLTRSAHTYVLHISVQIYLCAHSCATRSSYASIVNAHIPPDAQYEQIPK